MATVVVLYGPKAVGKSWVARTLVERRLGEALATHELVSVEATGAWTCASTPTVRRTQGGSSGTSSRSWG